MDFFCLFDNDYYNRCEMISHFGFDLIPILLDKDRQRHRKRHRDREKRKGLYPNMMFKMMPPAT